MGKELDDSQLIERSVAGDDEAYQMLVVRYENLVWDLLNRMVPNLVDREELAQDVFLKAFFNLHRFRFESKFSTWLYTIAYRMALSHLRKHKMHTVEWQEHYEALVPGGAEVSMQSQELSNAIDQLGLEDRTAITLYHLHNCSVEEIAAVMSKPQGTVKNQLFRARAKLKQFLGGDDP